MAAWWLHRSTWRWPCGAEAEVGREAIEESRRGATAGGAVAWFWDGFVDAAASGDGRRTSDRSALSPGACVEDSRSDGLDAAAASQARPGAGPGKSATVAEDEMACGKKNARRRKAWIFFQDESGVSQRPPIRRTWAPKGETPVLIHAFNWKKISVSVAIGYRWDGRRSRLFFQTRNGNYNSESLIAFLNDLKRELRGKKAILVWDGLPAHKSRVMTNYLRDQRGWLFVEQLPGYAPDLNPPEMVWGNIKGQELANRCAADLAELDTAVHAGMARVRRSPSLAFSFLHHVGLYF